MIGQPRVDHATAEQVSQLISQMDTPLSAVSQHAVKALHASNAETEFWKTSALCDLQATRR